MSSTYIVGIDLGTTHSALAYLEPAKGASAPVVDLPVPQLIRPGEVGPRPLLPSCVYLPGERELPEGALRLPWDEAPKVAVGELARWQGARVPGRLVASAKSWLAHPAVDRQAPILPWGAPAEVPRISPVEASALVLRHLARAFEQAHPGVLLAEQEVVITVPASFAEAARALTVSAAKQAGLERFTLLEEPQAAFYDFTSRHRDDLAAALGGARLVLVVDVGGGTTDFTLVQAQALPEGLALRRIAVGEHLMLGGDNMDAALAHLLEARLAASGRLPADAWSQLVHQARMAKEVLLQAKPPESARVAIAGGGSRLVGSALSAELKREEVEAALVEGFFPRVRPGDLPQRSARVGLQELGLPYAPDPAITRHLVAFLRRHAAAGWTALGAEPDPGPTRGAGAPTSGALPRPDAVLLNGGVFNSPRLSARLLEAVSALWSDAPPIPLLKHGSLDLSVARGAAYYGLCRRGLGRRIGGGAARAYYVGLGGEGAGKAVCLIPRGFDEGESVALTSRKFTLALGRPVQFQLFSTTDDRIDKPGEVVEVADSFRPLPPIHTVLSGESRGQVPVHLQAALTEIGTL
ncbi:MAG: Hsp70 family protein, partial [Myxococcaceae bacterium]